ncbi:Esterase-like activity of phytase [Streptomyces sp. DvalAA-14]|uniref:lamin tail domain-containing protein n=1 Tax=unclassified Streptomyces TaxID=2593676 RepID=UPI00081B961A|nr:MULTISPECIES: lamin tail domain-containing protein [unclassified Streptomyces]SCE40767.1 Esterase-like activity of phytase [Streptomyces sp. DvalAA-14]
MRTHWRRRAQLTAAALSVFALGLAGAPAVAHAQAKAQAAQSTVRINEVESNGGSPGDWVELVNTGSAAVDVSKWVVKDNDDSHSYKIAKNTSIAAGAFLALDVESSYGLGSADSARLFDASGTLVDSYAWTDHAATTYGRCPDGTGAFTTTTAPTKGAANACGSTGGGGGGQPSHGPWPGGSAVTVADGSNVFGENLSGLSFESPGVLWAVDNGPSKLYRLVPNAATWKPDSAGWSSGKSLHYPGGSGDPDAEGVVVTPDGTFVSTERDNDKDGTSLPEILRYDTGSTASSLNATGEWNLTSDLPSVPANSGLEGISWVPDSFLTAHGFRDEHTGAAYNPASYANHGTGLYFAGLEANGTVYAYALNLSTGGYTRVATITSGFPAVMDLEFEPATGHLWAVCDDTCQGQTTTLDINAQGRFAPTAVYDRPTGMADYNNEGFAIAPQSTCTSGKKPVVWSDDANDDGHALRAGTLNCTP